MSDHKLEEEIKKVSMTLVEEHESVAMKISISSAESNSETNNSDHQQHDAANCINAGGKLETGNAADARERPASSSEEIIRIGQFEVGELIAEGSASRIFHAKNHSLKGEFALKLISQDLYRTEAAASRLLQSLEAASKISHPNLATIYDCGRSKDGSIYIVTDYIKGRTLKDLIASGELLHGQRFIDIFRQVSQALKSLHQNSIVHGDLKPSNIFLVENSDSTLNSHDFIKLADFGITGGFTEGERLEYLKLSSKDGCPNYMSPEQCLSFGLDARSDIYSMGLIMHESLTGSPLVDGHSQVHALLKQLNLKPSNLRDSGWQISEPLEKIVMKCLEKNRSSRYFAIQDLELDLELAANDVSNLPGLSESNKMLIMEMERKTKSAEPKDKSSRRRKKGRLVLFGVLGGIFVSTLTAGLILRPDPVSLRHNSEMEMAYGMSLINSGMPAANWGTFDFPPIPPDFAPARPVSNHRIGSALRHFKHAEDFARRAIWSYRLENPFRSGNRFRHNLSELQANMGEIYLKDQFNEDGTRRDRSYWLSRSDGEMAELASKKLYPAFPGLLPTANAFPDYESADAWFDKAFKTLKREMCGEDLNLMWDRAYTKFQLNPKNPEVIGIHEKIIDVLQKQDNPDRESMTMAYRNIALIHLMNGEAGKAVHQFKEALKLDKELNKIPGPYSASLDVELAYAFLKEGKADVAEKLAKQNLNLFEMSPMDQFSPLNAAYNFNYQVLIQSLQSQGKMEEARQLLFTKFSPPTLLYN